MKPDSDFFNHLGTLNNGSFLQDTYDAYKNSPNNNSFLLNGALRSGFNLSSFLKQINQLNDIFRAKNNTQLTLYRMTSSTEFTPSGAEVALGLPFRYPAFLSTTKNIQVLQQFIPSTGIPVILKIKCPPGTGMALMEANNNLPNEEEVLLQSYTEYKITNSNIISGQLVIAQYLGSHNIGRHQCIYEIEMDITQNSFHLKNVNPNDFYVF
ncbi:ADP-ribosyltransferase [Enterobacter roggenkampii]|uniref:ADP-ribosyltransferase n=1 Tax=Enterobacter roggenkampii TaxID=1812935 RepID=UPI001E31B06C|nr:ADP-ribosyltransferase [Enterobacter roggenkampii]MCE1987191.1 ADP-ribosyltransferase [Enterobacter roggenkampii]